ncbi:hypothetical protein [Streptomyces tubercidicus]|uniref:hypothetical protein n=1 Tax=Streptomyces tubercidicus TaxID=47759 RepID=UPI00379183B4
MTDARLLDFPGSSIRLVKDVDDLPLDHRQLARVAVAGAFEVSRDLFVPLSMELSTAYWESEFDLAADPPAPSREFGMLRRSPLPERVIAEPQMGKDQVTTADTVSEATVINFIDDYLSGSPEDTPGRDIGWQEIQFNATIARLPDNYPREDPRVIELEVAKGSVAHPLVSHAGANWVYGPMGESVIHAPFECQIYRNPGELVLTLTTFWSIWAPGGPGRPAIEKGIAALLDSGWEVE